MNNLLFFFLGFIFCQWLCPLVDSILKYICTWIEAASCKYALTISDVNKQITEGDTAKASFNAIGFEIPEEQEIEIIDE